MADLRISQVLPIVKCSNCGFPVQLRQLADHVCEDVPPLPTLPVAPISIDTSIPSLSGHSLKSSESTSSPSSAGSKFNFQFWTGKARDTLKSVSHHRKTGTPTPENDRGPGIVEHAITTTLPFQRQGKVPSTRPTIAPSERPWKHNNDSDDFLTSPILDFSPHFPHNPFEPDRKNSTCPAPPGRRGDNNKNNSNKPKASQSSSSDEMSPLTPRGRHPMDALDYHLDHRRPQEQQQKNLPPCARCKRDVANDMDAMRIGQDVYHGQCFSCYTCRNRLDPRKPTLEYQGRIYCEPDYNMMVRHRLTCAACEQTIAAHVRPTRALGNYYHPEHIRCFHCNKPVDPEMTGLVERKGKIFCRPDFNKLYLPQCRGCGRAVEKEAVSSADGRLKGKWHKHCFSCHECHEPFPNNTFYIFENTPYCRRDYHKMNQSLCKGCDEPVEGRCARTAEGRRFHPQCFTCCVCKCMITDVYYLSDNRIYCANDRLFRSEKRQTFFQQL